jgi:uncharacterized protein YggE
MDRRLKIMESNQNIVIFYGLFSMIFTVLLIYVSSDKQQQQLLAELPSAYAQDFVFPDEKPTISVVGEAEKKILPDETKVSLAVENTEANANLARKNNAEKMDKIITVLKNNGLTNENISTSNFEIRPNYDTANNNFEKIVSYTALNKIMLTTSSNANISSFIDFAVNSGANRVDSIEFTSSKKVLNKNFKELLKEAFNDAMQKVEILSNEGNFLINGVKNIDLTQNNGYNPPIPYYALDQERMSSTTEKSDAPPTQITPRENTLSVTIPVTFFIDNINSNSNRSENQTQ